VPEKETAHTSECFDSQLVMQTSRLIPSISRLIELINQLLYNAFSLYLSSQMYS